MLYFVIDIGGLDSYTESIRAATPPLPAEDPWHEKCEDLGKKERNNMVGTKAGGLKAAATNKKIHGPDFYRKIGKKGGQNGHTGGFAANPKLARVAGAMGGRNGIRGYDLKNIKAGKLPVAIYNEVALALTRVPAIFDEIYPGETKDTIPMVGNDGNVYNVLKNYVEHDKANHELTYKRLRVLSLYQYYLQRQAVKFTNNRKMQAANALKKMLTDIVENLGEDIGLPCRETVVNDYIEYEEILEEMD